MLKSRAETVATDSSPLTLCDRVDHGDVGTSMSCPGQVVQMTTPPVSPVSLAFSFSLYCHPV